MVQVGIGERVFDLEESICVIQSFPQKGQGAFSQVQSRLIPSAGEAVMDIRHKRENR